jgi:hypothetical protein
VDTDPGDADDDPEEGDELDGEPEADVADAEDFFGPAELDVDTDPGDADDDPEEGDELLESGVSADATPCPITTRAPTPNAIASPPTRPTYAAALIGFSFGIGSRSLKDHSKITVR